MGHYSEGLQCFELALKSEDKNLDKLNYMIAVGYLKSKNYKQAKYIFHNNLKNLPKEYHNSAGLAIIVLKKGSIRKAMDIYEELNQDNRGEIFINLGICYQLLGKFHDAFE